MQGLNRNKLADTPMAMEGTPGNTQLAELPEDMLSHFLRFRACARGTWQRDVAKKQQVQERAWTNRKRQAQS